MQRDLHKLPTQESNPHGLHQRYVVAKTSGEPVDPKAIYLVLRLDGHGDDLAWIKACREAAWAIVRHAPRHMDQMSIELSNLLRTLESVSKEGA